MEEQLVWVLTANPSVGSPWSRSSEVYENDTKSRVGFQRHALRVGEDRRLPKELRVWRQPSEHGVSLAGYAAMELKKLTDGERGDIANNDCAEVFLRFLWYR